MKKLFLTVFSAILFTTSITADNEIKSIKNVFISAPARVKVVEGEKYELKFRNRDYDVYDYYTVRFKGDSIFITPKVNVDEIPSKINIVITAPECPEFKTNNDFFIVEQPVSEYNNKNDKA